MRELGLVPAPIFAPGHCMICGGSYGPMIDTRVDIPGDGRMYICTHVCFPEMIRLVQEVPASRRCTATKVDGTPCTAPAVAGHRYCVAHTKLEIREEEDERLVGSHVRE
jgi:hypothetical protein